MGNPLFSVHWPECGWFQSGTESKRNVSEMKRNKALMKNLILRKKYSSVVYTFQVAEPFLW